MTENNKENPNQKPLGNDDQETKDNDDFKKNSEAYSFIKNAIIGDVEITVNHKKQKNPVEVLLALHKLHHDASLSNVDKNKKAREAIKKYME